MIDKNAWGGGYNEAIKIRKGCGNNEKSKRI